METKMRKTRREPKGKFCFACGKLLTIKDNPQLLDKQIVCKRCFNGIDFRISEHESNQVYPFFHPGH